MSTVDPTVRPGSGVLDRGGLARDLERTVEGEVRFDEGSRALYANDASIYRQVPVGVVVPRSADDVVTALGVCRDYGAPIAARGAATGLAGQSVNAAVMFDFSKYMNRIVDLDPRGRTARVQPGVVCDDLRAAASEHELTFAPDPATHDRCTLGGMIGNNSCGTHSVMGGKTVDNVVELDVLTYDGTRMTVGATGTEELAELTRRPGRQGQIYRDLLELREQYAELIRGEYPEVPRRVSGYNLDDLLPEKGFDLAKALVGSEATCVLVLEATVRLLPQPPHRSLLVVGYPDPATAADHVPDFDGTRPMALECFDAGVLDNLDKHDLHIPGMDELPPGGAWLLAEYGADTPEEAERRGDRARDRLTGPATPELFVEPQRQNDVWEVRRSTIEYTRIPGEHSGLAGWEDAAVTPDRLGDYIRDYCALVARYGYHTVLFGHFGQGCVHNRLDLELWTPEGIATFHRFVEEAGDLVVAYGGSLSGEHGDGQLRASQLSKMFGSGLVGGFGRFKEIWDPERRMNPGKIVDAYSPVDNLALATTSSPREVRTHFAYPQDEHGFADAVNRCFGIGKCRHGTGGTMCPSYMVTGEEAHSTRGRARMLFEMMSGHLGPGGDNDKGWRDEHVKESLDLCLSCKGCKSDCPVGVDMATYKAEFLSHYYAGRLRPRAAYALGLLPIWARIASHAPRLVNAALRAPGLAGIGKRAAGVATDRRAPTFAARTFRSWFDDHRGPTDAAPVLLWPDTFTNHFTPEVGVAAVEVLEAAGYSVRIPARELCCGRPLYDYGMLTTARRWLRGILDELHDELEREVPVVVLEPSCLAVFRDELMNLMPDDSDAQRLAGRSVSLAEVLSSSGYRPPVLHRQALLQTHCHQQAVFGKQADEEMMRAMELDVSRPDSGCCGMAGSFGFEAGDKYEVSVAAGERVILPAVREASAHALVLADGFSCREQIAQSSDRRPLHLAQALALAEQQGPQGPADGHPEDSVVPVAAKPRGPIASRRGAVGVAVLAAVALGARAAARGRVRDH